MANQVLVRVKPRQDFGGGTFPGIWIAGKHFPNGDHLHELTDAEVEAVRASPHAELLAEGERVKPTQAQVEAAQKARAEAEEKLASLKQADAKKGERVKPTQAKADDK